MSKANIKLCASGLRVAPPHFRIWRSGSNPGDYGDLFVTPEAARRVFAEYQARGQLMIIDIEHGLNARVNPSLDVTDPPPTAGYLQLELVGPDDAPEVWAAPRWSDCGRPFAEPGKVCCGKHQIESGQREYISPDFDVDSTTREPIRLRRVALVAEPGTYGIQMLASAGANRRSQMDELAQIRAAYKGAVALSASSDEKIKAAAIAMCEQLKVAAAALGLDLDAEGTSDAEPPLTAAGDETKAPPAAPAAAAADETKAPPAAPAAAAADPTKPVPATASRPRPAPAISTSTKPITMGDVQRYMAEQNERAAMLADTRLSNEMRNVVASADLPTARAILGALPPKPAPAGTTGDAGGAVNTTASAGKPLSAEDKHTADHLREMLDVSPENVTATRKVLAGERDGSMVVSLKKLVEAHRGRRTAARA